MKKILSILLLLILVSAVVVGFYLTFEKKGAAQATALIAIPQSAAIVFESDEVGELWRDISQTNIIWEELKATDFYFNLDRIAHAVDSLLAKENDLRSYLSNKPIAASVHVSGARDYSYLLSLQLEADANEQEVIAAIPALFRAGNTVKTRSYDGVEIHSFTSAIVGAELFFFVKNGLLIMSRSALLAEEAIRAIEQGASVLLKPSFIQVRETKGSSARATLYINYKQLKTILSQYAGSNYRDLNFFTQPYAEWSALDLSIKANALLLNGFVLSEDSSDAWINAFRDVEAPEMQLYGYLPSNTAYFAFMGYGDYAKYRQRQLKIHQRANRSFALENKIKNYTKMCDCDIEAKTTEWIGSQAVAFITEPNAEDYEAHHFAVFLSEEGSSPMQSLEELRNALREVSEKSEPVELFKEYEIHRLFIGGFYGEVLSESFSELNDPYYTVIDNAVIMANSLNALRNLIQSISLGNTMAEDEAFKEVKERISNRSHFLIYSYLARSPYIYRNILKEEYAGALANQADVLRNFQAFVYQTAYYKNDLYYNNIYFKHNPDYKRETNTLWELELKAPVLCKPQLVTNHYTKALEIFAQDSAHNVYLIGNTGKVLWEVPVDGPVMGEVHQVDVYKNNKLQLLFNTPSTVYLLDRNGNKVEAYPKKLPSPATAAISVADYDNSRDYRFFIPLEDGTILSYDVTGKEVDGWEFKAKNGKIISTVRPIRIKSKDYLFALESDGSIHLLNRRGETRQNVTAQVNGLAEGTYQLEVGDNIKESSLLYIDSAGNAFRQRFDDRFDKIKLTDEPVLDYNFADIDSDGSSDAVLLTRDGLMTYNFKGDLLIKVDLTGSASAVLQTFHFPNKEVRFGITDTESEELMIYDRSGNLRQGFPLYGAVPFAIGDMNRDGYYNLITADKAGFLYAYAIE